MIEKVQYKDDEFNYQVFSYLYRSIFDFALEHNLDIWTEKKLLLNEEHLDKLITICEKSMTDILNKHYVEPSERQLSKNPGRYRRIKLGENNYKVDYRLNPVGREVVGMEYFREWLKKHKQSLPCNH